MASTDRDTMAEMIAQKLDQHSRDVPAVLALLHDSFAFMNARIDPPSSLGRMTAETVRDHAKSQEIWAISSPPRACMFLTIHLDHIYLGKLAVAEDARGEGLAKLLIETSKDRARQLNIRKIRLEVRIELLENQEFFTNQGFREICRTAHRGFERPTSITYEWSLINRP